MNGFWKGAGINMKRKLTTIILMLGLLGISLTAFAQEKQTPKQKPEPPKVLAVLFYADWCSSCKELEPKLNKVKRDFEGKPILFTRFDLTDEFTNDQAARYAALLGLENYYTENAGKTGYMLLIDSQSKKVLGRINKQNSSEEMKAALTTALAGNQAAG
jgi:thiol-disulfide isomerase/thioredoxin